MDHLDVGTVLLNWNGLSDTVECLTSIYAQEAVPAYVVLVDNGSADGSVEGILEWLKAHPRFRASQTAEGHQQDGRRVREFALLDAEDTLVDAQDIESRLRFVIVENGRNLGFAAGNNVGIGFLMRRGVKYVLLLNNDTVAAKDAFAILVQGMEESPERQCMVPQIRYQGVPDRIWNCGGEWTWFGMPRYYYAEENVAALDGKGPFEVTFVTGCAVIIRASWLEARGLLSERFFFGEEDVELSWRMRTSGAGSMGCWPQSVIYHKVGVSITRMAEVAALPKIYCYHLNRTIFLRTIWGRGARWHARRLVALAYLGWRLVSRFGLTPRDALAFVRDLWRDSSEKNGVSADFFFWLMKEKFQKRAA